MFLEYECVIDVKDFILRHSATISNCVSPLLNQHGCVLINLEISTRAISCVFPSTLEPEFHALDFNNIYIGSTFYQWSIFGKFIIFSRLSSFWEAGSFMMQDCDSLRLDHSKESRLETWDFNLLPWQNEAQKEHFFKTDKAQ
jgi:hypothetical protein